jgi:hypothetical protein
VTAPTSAAATSPLVCANCGLDVEDRGHPVAREGGGFGWYSNWVHADWGGQVCHPQQGAASCTAAPITLTAAALAFLSPNLAALLTDDVQRRQLLAIRHLIADDDLSRAWLIGMNPDLNDASPLGAIADGRGDQAMAAAREFVS